MPFGHFNMAKSNSVEILYGKRMPQRKQKTWPFIRAIRETFYEYCELTKVNGMYYLRRGVTRGILRLLWTLIPICLIVLAAVLVVLLWRRYLESPTRVTIGAPLKSVHVPFPGITICHPQSVMDYKAVKFVDKIKLPPGVSKERILDALPTLGIFTEHQWTFPDMTELVLVDDLLALNNISVLEAIMELGSTCEDFILVCRWAGREFPCFQDHKFLTWMTSTSHLGACCSFNYHPSAKQHIPFTANTYGLKSGLSIIGTGYPQTSDGKSGVLLSQGFMLLVHHPNDFAVESAPLTLLPTNTETFVVVYPTDSRCSDQVLELPLEQRDCIKSTGDFFYRQPACSLACIRQEVHRRCKCHPYHLPKAEVTAKDILSNKGQIKGPIKNCTVRDTMCFVENSFHFKTVHCNCLPSCSDVTYKVSSYATTGFGAVNYSINPLYKDMNLTNDEFIAHIFLANQLVPTNKKIVVMSWISLLSNLGGVFNLCLGISIISLIEVFYFVVIRFRMHYDKACRYYLKQAGNRLQIFT